MQTLLTRSKFGNFHPGRIDGEYGQTTAAAVRRAKWALGYTKKNIDGAFGDKLEGFLSGRTALPKLYALRRSWRIKPQSRRVREQAFDNAVHKIGVKESPAGSNHVFFSHWYGLIGPWCAMFASWCYAEAGSKAFKRNERYAYCPYILADAKAGKNGLRLTTAPERGDLVLYNWSGGSLPEHVGLFNHWIDSRHSSFATVEGNTAIGNDSNGGEVMARTRSRSQVVAFVRVVG